MDINLFLLMSWLHKFFYIQKVTLNIINFVEYRYRY